MDSQETERLIFERKPELIDLTHKDRVFPNSDILIPGEVLGYELWEEVLKKTGETDKEFGFIISTKGNKLLKTDIKSGENHSIHFDFFPHGLDSIGANEIIVAHSHPIPEKTAHIKATFPTDADIEHANGKILSVLILDKKSVQLIASNHAGRLLQPLPDNLVDNLFEEAKLKDYDSDWIRSSIARAIHQYGLMYYISFDPKPNSDGNIQLDLVR
ncbi:MAG: hypothetical protein ACD_30C00047G0022 [uncultured bacterium]|uniref:Uncharacterized protein n=4 Tax=Candidatus Daviesiibacteriota TaxID=1752718 RepID=A0A0G0HF36_9BACT|nr:MAG: hypothetical protein ACD_30C00047G0022 [uncultured bacterium]KKQ10709.1 MAG: hypothetical protein US19_C0001G0047 [Candidatus Daviesbacteria bacterium GW2011_GWB1_36_5]KKQ14517.1 MAG: hypothetical protein US28_C0035G0011 [Candidatus Daviesbacteria bacterium GW2011_GWA1_36_8]OGE16873.1 MAG: hypothetical protein A2858_03135 [Candidatus Daviesbacteria bacterium RIFCSPHIGHO2_01_FULL_36_37]OGE35860.1 MAG: hypothetical protein A3E66_01020 [Candidatus Daviesbacteria bacterium RIFCSPHIGHO2_12_F